MEKIETRSLVTRAADLVTGRSLMAAAIGGASALPMLAHAQSSPDPFDAAVATITTKVSAYGAALVALAAVGVVFYVAIKFVKKIPKAA